MTATVNKNGVLAGKVAVVTGASRGIGEAIALRYAQEGAKVVVSARTVEEGDHMLPGSINGVVKRINDASSRRSQFALTSPATTIASSSSRPPKTPSVRSTSS